jgi:acyl-CoA dehydrogenase
MVTLGTTRSQLDVWLPYFLDYCTAEQRERWFPGMAAGELLTAMAMTEPGTGSDLAGIKTRAVRDGDHYVLSGAKTFITGGYLADLVIVVARTSASPNPGDDPRTPDVPPENRREGLTLLVVEDGMPGFAKGRKLDKIGLKVQDTAELSFSDVRVPAANRLGEEGKAFGYLGHNLPQERLTIAVGSVAQSRAAVTAATEYAKTRLVFGKELSTFQNTKFELAACHTEVEAAQALLDKALRELVNGELSPADAAMVKLFTSEMQARVVDRCLQIFGGYGYITEYPIARLYADARVTRIYGGTSEVMKVIISKSMGLLSRPPGGDSHSAPHLGRGQREFPVHLGGDVVAAAAHRDRPRRLAGQRAADQPRGAGDAGTELAVLDHRLVAGQPRQLRDQVVHVRDRLRGERRKPLVAQERPALPPGQAQHERLAERGGVRGHVQAALEVLEVGRSGTFDALGHGHLLGADPPQVGAEPGSRLDPAQHLAGGRRAAERAEPLVEEAGDGVAADVRSVRQPGQVALVGERADQVVGGRQVEPAPPRDHLHGHGPAGADHFEDPERAPDALDEVSRLVVT